MINLFEKLNTLAQSLSNPVKNYWETDVITWDKNAKAPDKDDKYKIFDEEAMYESIRQSDIKRLLKFG